MRLPHQSGLSLCPPPALAPCPGLHGSATVHGRPQGVFSSIQLIPVSSEPLMRTQRTRTRGPGCISGFQIVLWGFREPPPGGALGFLESGLGRWETGLCYFLHPLSSSSFFHSFIHSLIHSLIQQIFWAPLHVPRASGCLGFFIRFSVSQVFVPKTPAETLAPDHL